MQVNEEAEHCSGSLKTVMADAVRGVALAVFGTGGRDKMLMAEMSVTASICELVQGENKTKRELSAIVDSVRSAQDSRNKGRLKELLHRSRMLRGTLGTMGMKRMGMEKQLETLRQSQINQNMLLSMKHTSDALQTIGMKVSDADNIMLDLEDSTADINSLQNCLSSSFMDGDVSDIDLSEELELILADDGMEPAIRRRQTPKKIAIDAVVNATEAGGEKKLGETAAALALAAALAQAAAANAPETVGVDAVDAGNAAETAVGGEGANRLTVGA
jgi:hypothetical protein